MYIKLGRCDIFYKKKIKLNKFRKEHSINLKKTFLYSNYLVAEISHLGARRGDQSLNHNLQIFLNTHIHTLYRIVQNKVDSFTIRKIIAFKYHEGKFIFTIYV